MNEQNSNENMGREEMMDAIKDCAAKLGHTPSYQELKAATGLPLLRFKKYFGGYSRALNACGLEREGCGYKVPMAKLVTDFAGVVRRMNRFPTMAAYELHSKYSSRPLKDRFGGWKNVAAGILHGTEMEGLQREFADVLDVLRSYCQGKEGTNRTSRRTLGSTGNPRILDDRPVYGDSLLRMPMAHAPVNEMGVVYLFGAMASRLGFILLWIGTEFPDGEALREVAPGKWQRVRIEFEFESYNFVRHMHNPAGCDLIVCWKHNWKDCPVEVVELKEALSNQHSAHSHPKEREDGALRGPDSAP